MFTKSSLLGLLVLGLSALPGGALEPAAPGPLSGYLPDLRAGSLPGQAVGVLVADPAGILKIWGRGGPPRSVALSVDGYYFWLTRPVPRASAQITDLQVPVGPKPGRIRKYPALNIWSLGAAGKLLAGHHYRLVSLVVNSGLGSPSGGEEPVATDVKALALDVDHVVSQLAQDYATRRRAVARDLEVALQESARAKWSPRQEKEWLFISWREREQELWLRHLTWVQAYQTTVPGEGPMGSHPGMIVTPGGVIFGVDYRVDRKAQLLTANTLPFRRCGLNYVER